MKQFYVGWPQENFPKKHVSEYKICWNDSCWFVEIISLLEARSKVIMSREIQGNVRANRYRFRISNLVQIQDIEALQNDVRAILLLVGCGSGTNQGERQWVCDTSKGGVHERTNATSEWEQSWRWNGWETHKRIENYCLYQQCAPYFSVTRS